MTAQHPDLAISTEVAAALKAGAPVVALESTIISHGMAYPANLDMATAVETIIRDAGATPATIAVLNGKLKVGLEREELELFAREKDVLKASTHDLPYALVTKRPAATTVAATIRIAAMAGIGIFATGGVGGVHRGWNTSLDISADITELGRTNVAVISAGAKAILDLPATMEALETAGVPIIAYGTDTFPAFYSRESGLKAPLRLDSAADIAAFLAAKWRLKLNGGALIANPIPVEHEIPSATIHDAIETALRDAKTENIAAKAVTPYLLGRIVEITAGKSLAANIALVKNNALLGAQIAIALAAHR